MKKSLLSLAIAATAVAGSVNAAEIYNQDGGSVDFYGQLRTEMRFDDSNDHNGDLTTGSSRIGVNGVYAISDNFDALATIELGVPANKSNDVTVRRHMVGFATELGTIQFGRDWTTSDDLGGTDYSYMYGGSGNLYSQLNGALHDSQIKYSLDLDNWWVKATYGFNDNTSQNSDLAEAFVGATYGDLSFHVGGGYNRNHAFDVAGANTMDVSNTYYEATVIYDVLNNLQLSGTYYGSQLKNNDGAGKVDQNAISVGGYWTFIEKTSLYGGYEFVTQDATDAYNDADEDGTNIFVGLEYKFSSWARVFAEGSYSDGTTLGFVDNDQEPVAAQKVDDSFNFGLGARFYW